MILKRVGAALLCLLFLAGCGQPMNSGELEKVGLLVPETIDDQVWGTKGYKGLLKIQSRFDVDVLYKESINSEVLIRGAVKEYHKKGVNLIFGHGNLYAEYFNQLSKDYPDIHFVSFNGDSKNENTTSLNFEGYAMGFFGGMVAAHMTKTNQVGVLAAYDWQPEVEGFLDGALFQKKQVQISTKFVNSWDDKDKALIMVEGMLEKNIDVIYPAGDGYNVPVIEKIKEHGKYAIGYVSEQSYLGESTILTSTVQHVDGLYELVAEKFNEGKLEAGNLYFDFQDNVISLGKFSPHVDEEFKNKMNQYIFTYKHTGKLPNEEE